MSSVPLICNPLQHESFATIHSSHADSALHSKHPIPYMLNNSQPSGAIYPHSDMQTEHGSKHGPSD